MAFISARIPDRLAAQFEAVAASRGGKSRLLRSLMESAVEGAGAAASMDAPGSAAGRSTKITVRLRDEDLAPLEAACAETGLRRTEWLIALLRRRLHGRPQFDRSAAESLLEIRRELRRLGVNLREMSETNGAGEGASAELESWRAEVRQSLERVRQVVAGNLAYWAAE
jgi:hypothetical protein